MSKELNVFIRTDNARVIVFGGNTKDARSIQVYRSFAPTEGWDLIAELYDGECSYADTERLTWNKSYDLYYKTGIVTDTGTEYSCVVQAASGLVWPYNAQAAALIKAANTEIRQNGREGVLLKTKEWVTRVHAVLTTAQGGLLMSTVLCALAQARTGDTTKV